jgi:cytochrome b561
MVSLHKATGLALLVLVILRIAVRLSCRTRQRHDLPACSAGPPAPRTAALCPDAGHAAAGLGHAIGGRLPAPARLAAIAPHNLQLYAVLRQAHGWAGYLLFATVLVHVGAALMHALGAPRRRVA